MGDDSGGAGVGSGSSRLGGRTIRATSVIFALRRKMEPKGIRGGLAGGAGLSLIFFTLMPIYIALIFILPIAGFAAALAFYKVNGRPFIVAMEHAFSYYIGSKLYLWQQREAKASDNKKSAAPVTTPQVVQECCWC